LETLNSGIEKSVLLDALNVAMEQKETDDAVKAELAERARREAENKAKAGGLVDSKVGGRVVRKGGKNAVN
jgi:AmiR/NasT family two-component response regulator